MRPKSVSLMMNNISQFLSLYFQVINGITIYLLIYWITLTGGTSILINEISFGREDNAYLELLIEEENQTPISLDGFQVIFVRRVHKVMYVEAFIQLKKMVRTLENFVLITAKNHPKIPSSSTNTLVSGVNTRFGLNVNEGNLFHMDKEAVVAIIITYGDIDIPELNIIDRQKKIHFTKEIAQKLQDQIKDLVIVGGINGKSPRDLIKFLSDVTFLADSKLPRKYSDKTYHSYSRCSDSKEPFLSERFKDTVQTPSMVNNCATVLPDTALYLDPFKALSRVFEEIEENCAVNTAGDFLEIVQETGHMIVGQTMDVVDEQASGNVTIGDTSFEIDDSGVFESTAITDASGSSTSVARYTPVIPNSCPNTMDVHQAMGATDAFIARNKWKRKFSDPMLDHNYSLEWEKKYISPNDELTMNTYQPGIYPTSEFNKYLWIEYVIDDDDPKNSKIRCGTCFRYADLLKMRESDKFKIMKEGIKFPTISQNLRAIEDHSKSNIHLKVIQVKKFNEITNIKSELNSLDIATPHGSTSNAIGPESPFKITSRIIVTVYELASISIDIDMILYKS